jgi:hypothetical protein
MAYAKAVVDFSKYQHGDLAGPPIPSTVSCSARMPRPSSARRLPCLIAAALPFELVASY